METGDYICVEDTSPAPPRAIGYGVIKEPTVYEPWGTKKLDELKLFMKDRGERYLVDQRYTDFFG